MIPLPTRAKALHQQLEGRWRLEPSCRARSCPTDDFRDAVMATVVRPTNPCVGPHARQIVERLRSELRQLAIVSVADVQQETSRLARARGVCHRATIAYWTEVAVSHSSDRSFAHASHCPVTLPVVPAALTEQAAAFGRDAASTSPQVAAYLLSTLYAAMLPDTLRSANGIFFTPPALVERLLDLVEQSGVDWLGDRVVDPAAGGGAFIAPVATRIASRLVSGGRSSAEIVAAVEERVSGVEIDPFLGWLAWVFLEVALWPHCLAAHRRLPNPVRAGSALELTDDSRSHLVIGNPPFGKLTLPDSLRKRFARSLFGHANLYGVFTDLAVRLATPRGIVGYVVPSSFLAGQYFQRLRHLLATEAPPLAIDFIADRADVFDNVLQETVLVVLGPGKEISEVMVHFLQPTSLDGPCEVSPVGQFPLPVNPCQPWLLPRRSEDIALLKRAMAMPHRLADYGYEVSTGPLVWNRHRRQLAAQAGVERLPILWAESVQPTGTFRFAADRRGHVPWFALAQRQEHLVQRRPCVLIQRTTAKEQRRRLIAAVLPAAFLDTHGGVVIENHVNVLRRVRVDSNALEESAMLDAIAAFLNSAVADQLFRCVSGSVAVSAYELEALPLPDPDAMEQLAALASQSAAPSSIDRFLKKVYFGKTFATD